MTNVDTAVTERNEVAASGVGIAVGNVEASDATAVAAIAFDYSRGTAVADMSADMLNAFNIRAVDYSSTDMGDHGGYTDFAAKFYIAVTLADAGSVQGAGRYIATATVRALPTVS